MCMQEIWYQVSQWSHLAASCPHLTAFRQTPQGYLGVRGPGLGDISPDTRRRSVCSILVLTEGLCLEVNFEVQFRIDSSRPSI